MRVEGWEKIAIDYIEKAKKSKFVWGLNDCVLFSCDLAKEMTGKDPAESIRGKYSSQKEALKLIKANKRKPEDVMGDYFLEVHCNFAQRGDIVFRRNSDLSFNFGIVWDGKAFFLQDGEGVVSQNLKGLKCWRVE